MGGPREGQMYGGMVGAGTGGWEQVGQAKELVEMEDGKGVEGWLDPGDRYLECRVVVGSWTDWGWAEGVKQMGMERVTLVAFTQDALDMGDLMWGESVEVEWATQGTRIDAERLQYLFAHLPLRLEIKEIFGFIRELGARVWIWTLVVEGTAWRE